MKPEPIIPPKPDEQVPAGQPVIKTLTITYEFTDGVRGEITSEDAGFIDSIAALEFVKGQIHDRQTPEEKK